MTPEEQQKQHCEQVASTFKHGLYRHYKGGLYTTLYVAIEEATLTPVVVYRSHQNTALWTRPWADFIATVEVNGHVQPRFSFEYTVSQ